jgi:transcriptional regulator with XRE-family HTH domain
MPDSGSSGQQISGAPTVLRILLGTQLRRLRESRGITAQAAARAIRGSESKISRIELGRNAVREIDIADLLDFYGLADPAERERLLALASKASQPAWWHPYLDILPSWFPAYLGLEESAESIRSFDNQFVPSLLRSDEYARAVLQFGAVTPGEADRLLSLHQERKRRIAVGGLRISAIIDEVVLRRPVGNDAVLRGQLRYLLDLSGRSGLTIQVSPLLTGAWYAAPASFAILSFAPDDLPDVVYSEQLTGALYLDKPAEVARYAAAMEQILALSCTPRQSHELIAEAMIR